MKMETRKFGARAAKELRDLQAASGEVDVHEASKAKVDVEAISQKSALSQTERCKGSR